MQRESSIGKPNTSNGRDVEIGQFSQTPQQATRIRNTTAGGSVVIWLGSGVSIETKSVGSIDVLIAVPTQQQKQVPSISEAEAKKLFRAVTQRLIDTHKNIRVDDEILAGTPHIKGSRISVAHALAELYHLGSITAVTKKFHNAINRSQVKEALAYAHDFLETACDLSEDDD